MNAQELIQARIGDLEAEAKRCRANARDLQKQANDADGAAINAEEQITELKAAIEVLDATAKAEKKPAAKKKA